MTKYIGRDITRRRIRTQVNSAEQRHDGQVLAWHSPDLQKQGDNLIERGRAETFSQNNNIDFFSFMYLTMIPVAGRDHDKLACATLGLVLVSLGDGRQGYSSISTVAARPDFPFLRFQIFYVFPPPTVAKTPPSNFGFSSCSFQRRRLLLLFYYLNLHALLNPFGSAPCDR